MNQPNIFSYATSELSQDAFICWLLSWASPECSAFDLELHECAISLIESFFLKHEIAVPTTLDSVVISKQDDNIDVLCIVNHCYSILIEDKTGTRNHSNQLTRYFEQIQARGFAANNILPIYYKTEDQGCYDEVLSEGYQPFLRGDILRVLNAYQGNHAILLDYRRYLQSISASVERYQRIALSEWDRRAWIGFYLALQDTLPGARWDYVSNPSDGFLGFWWGLQGDTACEQYLQLEQDTLCFKIRVQTQTQRKSLRSKWYEVIRNASSDFGLNLIKPVRFGNGRSMTVCVLDGDYRAVTDGVVDVDKTIITLRSAEKLLKSVQEK
ncbi:MAG: hypothetical protein COB04_07160 [Gammaproteobacteria bacterium]|nr:MAG: hypothetical protein COB04_07160 [Gammaproteobacteria bacterium]